MYGGARGGGKTDGMLGKFGNKQKRHGENVIGVFFRRTREDLKEAVERSKQIYGPMGASLTNERQWRFPNGARLKFEYLDRDKDADNYQGHNYTDLFFEELTHWPDPTPVNKLKATLRSPTAYLASSTRQAILAGRVMGGSSPATSTPRRVGIRLFTRISRTRSQARSRSLAGCSSRPG